MDSNQDKSKRLYCCVIHKRQTSAWVKFGVRQVQKSAVAYCGAVTENPLICSDEAQVMQLTIYEDTLHFRIDNNGERFAYTYERTIPYEKDEMAVDDLPICDAMESWVFVISEHPVDPDIIMEGYQKDENGLYYKKAVTDCITRRP